MSSVSSTSCSEARIVGVRSALTDSEMAAGMEAAELREQFADAIDGFDDVRARLAEKNDEHRRLAVRPVPSSRMSSTESSTVATSDSRTAAPFR